jgi:hypothetical protein
MNCDCPINGCTTPRRPGQLMCKSHWHMVPRVTQRAVTKAWRAIYAGKTLAETREAVLAHAAAKQDAIKQVMEALAPVVAG